VKLFFVLYTHTDYKDVWPIYFGQMKKYYPWAHHYIFVNKEDADIPKEYYVRIYDEKLTYRERVLSCLKNLHCSFLIYHHEDMFLYDTPDQERLVKYLTLLGLIENKSFIKLIRGGTNRGRNHSVYPELRFIDKEFEYIFAIQPSIWKTDKFEEVFEHSKGNTIWEFEIDAQNTCRSRNIYGFYVDDGGVQRGRYHWDSKVYPYVATAVVKGKWNTKEYPEELKALFERYKIDPKIRGTNS
jgi:hypothetical protein